MIAQKLATLLSVRLRHGGGAVPPLIWKPGGISDASGRKIG